MTDEQLVEYIKAQLRQHFTKEYIYSTLGHHNIHDITSEMFDKAYEQAKESVAARQLHVNEGEVAKVEEHHAENRHKQQKREREFVISVGVVILAIVLFVIFTIRF